jgi:hypothetical protein
MFPALTITAASRTPPWLLSGWECRGWRPIAGGLCGAPVVHELTHRTSYPGHACNRYRQPLRSPQIEGLLAELSPFAGTPTPRHASPGLSRRVFLDLGSSIHPQEPNGVFESKLTAGVTPGAKRLALDDSPVQGFFFFPPSKPPSWLTRSAGFPVVFVPGTVPPAQLSSDLRIPAATPPTSGAN